MSWLLAYSCLFPNNFLCFRGCLVQAGCVWHARHNGCSKLSRRQNLRFQRFHVQAGHEAGGQFGPPGGPGANPQPGAPGPNPQQVHGVMHLGFVVLMV